MKRVAIIAVIVLALVAIALFIWPYGTDDADVVTDAGDASTEELGALGGPDSDGSEPIPVVDDDPPAQPIERTQFDEGATAGTTEEALDRSPDELLTVDGFEFVAARRLIEESDIPETRQMILIDTLNHSQTDEEQLRGALQEVREELGI